MDIYNDTYLPDILHDISQGMLTPAMVCIILLLLGTIFFVAQVIVEYFTERRHFRQNMPRIINDFNDAPYDKMTDIVFESRLLLFQKAALSTVTRNMGLPEDSLFALAQIQINGLDGRYQRRLAWTDTMSKIAPLLGLMGTLIPLGPGIVAMGQGQIETLSSSLLLAFDATVCGLICAILCLVVSKVRSGWYTEYVNSIESLMTCITEKAEIARKEGVQLSTNYSGDPVAELKALEKGAKSQAKSAPSQVSTARAAATSAKSADTEAGE